MKKILLTSLLLLFSLTLVACNKTEEISLDENDIEDANLEEADKILSDDDLDKLSEEFPDASKEEIKNISDIIKDIYYLIIHFDVDFTDLVSNGRDVAISEAMYTIEYSILKGDITKNVFEDMRDYMIELKNQYDNEYIQRRNEERTIWLKEYPDIDKKYHDIFIEYLEDYYENYYSIVNNNFKWLYGVK